jgi:hypothetical protein
MDIEISEEYTASICGVHVSGMKQCPWQQPFSHNYTFYDVTTQDPNKDHHFALISCTQFLLVQTWLYNFPLPWIWVTAWPYPHRAPCTGPWRWKQHAYPVHKYPSKNYSLVDYLTTLPLSRLWSDMDSLMEWELVGEIEVLGENYSNVMVFTTKITHGLTWVRTRAAAVGTRRTNRLNYGMA